MQVFQRASALRLVQLLADSQYYAEQGPVQNFMDHSTPSDRQEGCPTELKVKFTGSREKAAKEGRNAKECNRYDTGRMLRLRKGMTADRWSSWQ